MTIALTVFTVLLAALDGPPVFQAATVGSEKSIGGQLEALRSDWSVKLGDQSISTGDLIELSQVGVARPKFPFDRPHILLVNGDRWPGQVAAIKDDKIRFVPAFGRTQEILVPVSCVAYAWLTAPRSGEVPDPGNFDLLAIKRRIDEVLLNNKDIIRGTVVSADNTTLRLDTDGRITSIPIDRVRTIAFNTELAKSTTPRGATAKVTLTSGARITLTEALFQDGRIAGKSLAGPEVRLILSECVRLELRSPNVVVLGDLKPIRYEHTPYLGTPWPFTVDRSTHENQLMRLGPHVVDRGIGMHSQSQLTYAIPRGATRWEAVVGLDAEAAKQGNVFVKVVVDGRAMIGPDEFSGATLPKRLVVNLAETAKELTLVVDFGANGDVQDHFVWGDARFVIPKQAAASNP